MSRRFQSGAETGVADEWGYSTAIAATEATLTASTTQHTGTGSAYSWRFYKAAGTGFIQDYPYFAMPSSVTQTYAKMDVYVDNMTASVDSTHRLIFYPMVFSAGYFYDAVGIYYYGGVLHIVTTIGTEDAVVDDYTTSIGLDTWFRLEAYFDTTPADGSEILTVKLNGATVIENTSGTFHDKTSYYNVMRLASSISTATSTVADIYMDNMSWNSTAGSINNSWIGEEYIMPFSPTGAGDSNPTAGDYTSVNEIPYTTTATSSANRIELDDNSTEAWFTIDPSALASYDVINAVSVPIYMKEEALTTTSYQIGIRSASAATPQKSTAADAGNTIVKMRNLISETDPTTTGRWTVIGTNSLTNAQIGVLSLSANDIWVTAMSAMVAYTPGTPSTSHGLLIMFW